MDDHFLFYVPPDQISGNKIRFSDEEARHISKVLRKRAGDTILVTDGTGNLLTVRLIDVDKKGVDGEVMESTRVPAVPERILAMGVIRQRDRLEFAVEKAVELGASRLILVHSDHAEKVSVKAARIDKIIISSMKQSRRAHLPMWEERQSFAEVIAEYRGKCRIIMAHPEGTDRLQWRSQQPNRRELILADVERKSDIRDSNPTDLAAEPLLIMVGPEGGFSDLEVEQAKGAGAEMVSLGPARLRAETAVCAVLALMR